MEQAKGLTPERLKEIRGSLKMSRSQLAKLLKIHYKTLWGYETGGQNIPAWMEPAIRNICRDVAEWGQQMAESLKEVDKNGTV